MTDPDRTPTMPIAVPSMETMMAWDGYALATDGCKVEPDGRCPHDCPSLLVVYGLI